MTTIPFKPNKNRVHAEGGIVAVHRGEVLDKITERERWKINMLAPPEVLVFNVVSLLLCPEDAARRSQLAGWTGEVAAIWEEGRKLRKYAENCRTNEELTRIEKELEEW